VQAIHVKNADAYMIGYFTESGKKTASNMKLLIVTLSIMLVTAMLPVFAGQAEYDDCILKYLKGAKLDVAANLIKQACEENYRNPSFTSDKRRAYNKCLLEHPMEIRSACNRKHN